MVFLFYFVLFPQRLQIHQSELPPYSTKRQYVLLYNHSTLINQFFQLILFLSVLISILQNFIIYFQLHSPKLLYFLPIIASFWEIIKCVGIIILLSFFLSLQQLHCPFHRSFRAHMHLQFPLTDAGKSFLQHRQIPRGSSLGQNGAGKIYRNFLTEKMKFPNCGIDGVCRALYHLI